MKNIVAVLFALLAIVSLTSCYPQPSDNVVQELDASFGDGDQGEADDSPLLQEALVPERANRQRRVTCDLLSFSVPWGSLNHSACAAHCIAMMKGFRGGRCINGVCNCRK